MNAIRFFQTAWTVPATILSALVMMVTRTPLIDTWDENDVLVFRAHGFIDRLLRFGHIRAITIGETVIFAGDTVWDQDLQAHELRHVWQWRHLGFFLFPLAYYLPMPVLLAMGRRPYYDHPLEIDARAHEPSRSLL